MSVLSFTGPSIPGQRPGVEWFTRRTAERLATMGRNFVEDPDSPFEKQRKARARERARRAARAEAARVRHLKSFFREAHRLIDAVERVEQSPMNVFLSDVPLEPVFAKIRREVTEKYSVSLVELISHRRTQVAVLARHECMWRMRTETRASFPEIGRAMGYRDHTTIMHGVRRHQERLARQSELQAIPNHHEEDSDDE